MAGVILLPTDHVVPEKASWVDPSFGLTIRYSRVPSDHPFLAEYKRTITLETRNRNPDVFHIFDDTGGTHQMNIYRESDGTILLRDRLHYYSIQGVSLTQRANAFPKIKAEYLGRFDHDEQNRLAFYSQQEKPEKELEDK